MRLAQLTVLALLCTFSLAFFTTTAQCQTSVGAPPPAEETTWYDDVDHAFGTYLVAPMAAVLMFDVLPTEGQTLPFIVAWLVLGATFFTLRMGFINLRGMRHAIEITMGRYDNPEDEGEVSHFQALSSALSATVGLGNIAGVALAVSAGGPGAVFWMVVAGFLGMSTKFVECTLGQMYRSVEADGSILGGPMRYLELGLGELGARADTAESRDALQQSFARAMPTMPQRFANRLADAFARTLPPLGRVFAVLFAVLCVGGSFGGGNMFQANQAFAQAARVFPALEGQNLLFGVTLAGLVGVVIIGGIKRIGRVAERIVPLMCGVYFVAGVAILLVHASAVPAALATIVGEAFTPQAGLGGMLGTLVTGFRRAAFSNEAGVGSASIAHSAASTSEPIREGLVALLEPFIDTIIICTMTGLVVVVTGEYQGGTLSEPDSNLRGVLMTSAAFASVFPWFPYVLALAVLLFAFSTMVSWSYYGERAWTFLFGPRYSLVYRIIFLCFVVLGSILKLSNVTDFSDLMILGMALPNIAGLYLLSGKVKSALERYWAQYVVQEAKR